MSARVVQEERCVSDKVCGPGRFILTTTSSDSLPSCTKQPAAVFHLDHVIYIAIINYWQISLPSKQTSFLQFIAMGLSSSEVCTPTFNQQKHYWANIAIECMQWVSEVFLSEVANTLSFMIYTKPTPIFTEWQTAHTTPRQLALIKTRSSLMSEWMPSGERLLSCPEREVRVGCSSY